jgi:hypothetical protein
MPCNKIKLVDVPDMNYFAKDGKGEVSTLSMSGFLWWIDQFPVLER